MESLPEARSGKMSNRNRRYISPQAEPEKQPSSPLNTRIQVPKLGGGISKDCLIDFSPI